MKELVVAKQTNFGNLICDIYSDSNGNFFMTRRQIGKALEYENPDDAIYRIHERHKERLDRFSVLVKLSSTDRKQYETILYSAKGIYEICRWSRQPKADQFYDNVYEILENLRLGYLKFTAEKSTQQWIETRYQGKLTRKAETDTIQKLIEYAQEQGSKNADKLYLVYSKLANSIAGIQGRDKASVMQLNNLSLIENIILHTIDAGIQAEKSYKAIYKDCKARLEIFKDVAYLSAS